MLVGVAVGVGVAGAVAAPASALTAKQATARALRVLRPQRVGGSVVVFGLGHALSARDSVVVDVEDPTHPTHTYHLRALGHRAWLFWEDLQYGAQFEHPSRLVLVDDRTGRVGRPVDLKLWPLVDGRDPPFIGRGYRSSHLRVYASPTVHAATAPPAPTRSPVGPRANLASAFAPGTFAHDCVVTIGRREDPMFASDFSTLLSTMGGLGVRTLAVPSSSAARPADGRDLERFVDQLVAAKQCTDIVIYVDGHGGYKTIDGKMVGIGAVNVGNFTTIEKGKEVQSGAYVFNATLELIAIKHPEIGFKVIVDACFAASMASDDGGRLSDRHNVLVGLFSSNATESSWSWLGDLGLAGYNTGNTGDAEFTYGLTRGIAAVAASPTEAAAAQSGGGSVLARVLDRAFVLAKPFDFAQTSGRTHPEEFANLPNPPTPPGSPAPPAAPTCTATATAGIAGDPSRVGLNAQCTLPFSQVTVTLPTGLTIVNDDPPLGATCTLSNGQANCLFNTPAQALSGLNVEQSAPPPAAEQIILRFVGPAPFDITQRVTIE